MVEQAATQARSPSVVLTCRSKPPSQPLVLTPPASQSTASVAAVAMAAMLCLGLSVHSRLPWGLVAPAAQPEMAPACRWPWKASYEPRVSKHLAFRCRALAEVAATAAAAWPSLEARSPQHRPLADLREQGGTLVMSLSASVDRSKPAAATHQARSSAASVAVAAPAAVRSLPQQARFPHPLPSAEMEELAGVAAMSAQPWRVTSQRMGSHPQGL